MPENARLTRQRSRGKDNGVIREGGIIVSCRKGAGTDQSDCEPECRKITAMKMRAGILEVNAVELFPGRFAGNR